MTYSVMMIDPPWPTRRCGDRKARHSHTGQPLPYKLMHLEDIVHTLSWAIFPLLTEDSPVIFFWSTEPFLRVAEDMMDQRGFTRHARLIWNKGNGFPAAYTIRVTHEYLLWYYKSPLRPVAPDVRGKFGSVFSGKWRQHSRKPDEAYALVDALYPDCTPKLDVFSRERRFGWDQWGDECSKFNVPILGGQSHAVPVPAPVPVRTEDIPQAPDAPDLQDQPSLGGDGGTLGSQATR